MHVLVLSLELLVSEKDLPEAENRINELLLIIIKRVWKKLPNDKKPIWALCLESQNQPQETGDVGAEWVRKKPDFQWQYVDHTDSTERGFKSYTIECKRLGRPLNKNRILNSEYIEKGVRRFVISGHSYAKGSWSGAMLGYVQNMNLLSILKDVNECIMNDSHANFPNFEFPKDSFGDKGVARTSQRLVRIHVSPSPFDLRHLWVDLRK